jgi:hypothetical protein
MIVILPSTHQLLKASVKCFYHSPRSFSLLWFWQHFLQLELLRTQKPTTLGSGFSSEHSACLACRKPSVPSPALQKKKKKKRVKKILPSLSPDNAAASTAESFLIVSSQVPSACCNTSFLFLGLALYMASLVQHGSLTLWDEGLDLCPCFSSCSLCCQQGDHQA